MKSLKITIICCLLLFAASVKSKGFETPEKCAMPSLETAFKSSKAVFVGKALSETKDGDVRTFEFQVEKYWKGANSKNLKVSFRETMRYQAWFRVGEQYLVFARQGDDGKLYDGRCSGTKLLSQASVEIKKLGKAKIPGK